MQRDLPPIPPADELAALAMTELQRRGGGCDIDEFRRIVATHFPISEAVPRRRKAWQREFDNTLHWAMVVLLSLEEVCRLPASTEHPSGRYEVLPSSSGAADGGSSAVERRRAWLANYVKNLEEHQWD